jgi:hypothetical protein
MTAWKAPPRIAALDHRRDDLMPHLTAVAIAKSPA